MPHTIDWLQEGKVLISRFEGVLTIQEMFDSTSEYIALFEGGNPPIHIITDLSNLKKFPTSLMQVRDAYAYLKHEKAGWLVYYGAPALASSLINVFNTIEQLPLGNFRSYEQALAFLHDKDKTVKLDKG